MKKQNIFLLLILGIACFLRFYKLSFQSFWLDELHSAIEADPKLSWQELFTYLKCGDYQPPLFFILERLLFTLFGSTEWVARSLNAMAGTAGVFAVFLLGKELLHDRLGLIAACIACINYFHILYSQDARPYPLSFLFAGLSFLYFIRLLKDPKRKHAVLYTTSTLLLLYTHYYSIFILASQMSIGVIIYFTDKENRKERVKNYLLSLLAIFVLYSPWIPVMLSIASNKSFWIQPIPPSFAIDFFFEYFGNSDLLKPFLILFLLSATLIGFGKGNLQFKGLLTDKISFTLFLCILWIGITLLIPYLRSILTVPMLYPRYTIVVLPAFFILLALGIEFIPNRILKFTILGFFCLLSLTELTLVKKYYTQIRNTQFREMAKFIAAESIDTYPVISEITAWHQQYYLKQFGCKAQILEGKKETIIESVFSKSNANYMIPGFWISDGHGATKPSTELQQKIDSQYFLLKEQDFKDSYAQLYVRRDSSEGKYYYFNFHSFNSYPNYIRNGDTCIVIWEKQAISNPLFIRKGKYRINFLMSGDKALGEFPHLNLYLNDKLLGSVNASENFRNFAFTFETLSDQNSEIKIVMDNDKVSEIAMEDRNAFIKSITFLKTDN